MNNLRIKNKKFDVGVMGFWYGHNYGSQLTYFALNTVLKNLGKTVLMIENPRISPVSFSQLGIDGTFVRNFAYKHYNCSEQREINYLFELNEYCENFLLGSDQVFNPSLFLPFKNSFFLSFAAPSKRRIAYSASFGSEQLNADEKIKKIMSYYLHKFDSISVREASGITLLKEKFNIDAEMLLDPVFLCPREKYIELIDKNKKFDKDNILAYILDPTEAKRNLILAYSKKIEKKYTCILDYPDARSEKNKKKLNLENVKKQLMLNDFIGYYKNADFIITDSFHGTCFAILFKKPFIAIVNKNRGTTRFESILNKLGLMNRLVYDCQDAIIDIDRLIQPINYDEVYKIIEEEKEKAIKWLKNAFEKPVKIKYWDIELFKDFYRTRLMVKKINYRICKILSKFPIKNKKKYEDRAISLRANINKTQKSKYKNISQLHTRECIGCFSCYNKCPANAIEFVNKGGFSYPIIDKKKCINCGLCVKVCPAIKYHSFNNSKPTSYAVKASDEIRKVSSSGGVFTLLAEYILDKGGYVCGAAFKEDWNVHHIIVDNKEDLTKLRGSKYVQSSIGSCYIKIKQLLENNKYVLFSGTPCQVAGLNNFLDKEYEKLITVDIFCHGAPSPKIWQNYLKTKFGIENICNINFRDKSKIGWSCSHCTITLKDNQEVVCNEYTQLFHKSLILRDSCSYCKYSKYPRPADISLGDFWGIKDYAPEMDDSMGTSIVLINSSNGEKFFDEVKNENIDIKEIELKQNYNNGHLIFGLGFPKERKKFLKRYFNDIKRTK